MNMKKRTKSAVILTVLVCSGIFVVSLELGADAHAQENSTAGSREIQTMPSNQTPNIEVIKNITSAQNKVFEKMATSLSKSSTQGAFTALSVFFLGIALVVLGLRMTSRGLQAFGRYFNLMVWALTLPVLALITIYQVGIATGSPIMIYASDEPYLVISFLMYIPLGIVLFMLLAHGRMKQQ
jgi:hypothetical protein